MREDLLRVARSRVVIPGLAYAKTPDGHLVRLEDARGSSPPLPRPRGRSRPRADFPLTIEPKLLLRTASGEAYAAGLVRAELGLGTRNGARRRPWRPP